MEPVVATARSARRRPLIPAAAFSLLLALGCGTYYLWLRSPQSAASAAKTTIAVLPFKSLSGDPDQAYFAEGFTDELIAQLGRNNPTHLGVIARTSTLSYRETTKSAAEIGRELVVQHLVEGTVRRSGNRVRINAQLIRVSDQSHVWAEIYEGEIRDILQLQREVGDAITRHILSALGTATAGSTPLRNVDPAVYDLYLRGRHAWNTRNGAQIVKATDLFKQAVQRDPTFAPAWAGIADALSVHARAEALEAAEKAISLDDRLAEAHCAKAEILTHMLRWAWAEQEYRRSIALDPHYVPSRYFYSEFLVARGRRDEAIEQAREAMAIDPMSAIAAHVSGVTRYYSGDNDNALRDLKRALELDPQHTWSHWRIGLVLERQHSYDAALHELMLGGGRLRAAHAYALAGRPADARRIIAEALASPDVEAQAYQLAGAYAGLGDLDEAMTWLERALFRQLHDVIFMAVDPRLERLHDLPKYRELLRQGGWE